MNKRLARERRAVFLPLLAATALLLAGFWLRWPVVLYDGPPTEGDLAAYSFERLAYSDIGLLYFRDGLASGANPVPYLDYPLEYPVGTGLVIWLLGWTTGSLTTYFLATSLFLAVCGLLVARLIPEFPRGNAWLFALSPALALYVNLNWDMWGVLLMVATLLLFARGRDGSGAVALAAATWTKFFPVLFLPLVVADGWRRKGRKGAGRVVLWFGLASVAINGPLLLLTPEGWWHFFGFNAGRGGGLNVYTLFLPEGLDSPEVSNRIGAGAILLGILALVFLLLRRTPHRGDDWLLACAAIMAWFLFWNKISSPQYDLWVVVLLAIVGASPALAVAFSGVDVLFFLGNFVHGALGQRSVEAQDWWAAYVMQPSAVARELAVVAWCVARILRTKDSGPPAAQTTRSCARGKD